MKTMDKILKSVARASGIKEADILSYDKRATVSIARNMFCYIARQQGFMNEQVAKFLGRSPGTVSLQTKQFTGWLETGDRLSAKYYECYNKKNERESNNNRNHSPGTR
jgi:chromosomal replication initiation ATPase DnaA